MSRCLAALAGLMIAWLGGCTDTRQSSPAPVDLTPDVACAVDGMLLAVHHGPKSQLLRADGSRAFYCDTKEIFTELLDPVRRRRVAGAWFQTLDNHAWEAHGDGWAAPDSLLFVAGSGRMGPMGPTLAPFTSETGAQRFVDDHGGRIVRYRDINPSLIAELQRQWMGAFD